MAIQDDWTIDYSAKTVTHTSGTDVYTVLEFFQWMAQTFANSSQMDDDYAFVSDTPQVYRWVNSWAFGVPATDPNFLSGGSIESSDANELWSALYSIGSQVAGTQIYVIQDGAEITPWWPTGNIDILVLVRSGGALIDAGNVLVMAREFGDEYDHNFVDLSAGSRNPVGINTAPDINNTTPEGTVAGWTADFTINFGSFSRDLNNGNGLQPYDVELLSPTRSESDAYEYWKYLTRRGSTADMDGIEGQQYRSADPSYTDVKKAPFGTLAGGKFFGARGIWATTLNSNFTLTDSNNAQQNPPSYQNVAVNNDNLSGCQIFVAEISGGDIVKNQYTISATTANSITVGTAIDINKTPQTGVLRVDDAEYTYSGFDGSDFAGVSPDPSGETGGMYVPLLSVLADATTEVSDNIIYGGDINVRTIVRKYGFKEYTTDTLFTENGLSFSPILTIDPQAT